MFIKMEVKEKHNRSALMRVQPNNSNSVTIAALVKTPNICHSHYRNAQWGKGQILCQRALKWIWIVGWKWVCGFLFVGDAKPGPVSPPFPSDFYFKFIYSFFHPQSACCFLWSVPCTRILSVTICCSSFSLFFFFLISTVLICEPQIIFSLVSFELSHVLCWNQCWHVCRSWDHEFFLNIFL